LSAIPREKKRGRKSKQGKGADENWERTQNSIKRQQGENVATEIEKQLQHQPKQRRTNGTEISSNNNRQNEEKKSKKISSLII